MKTTISMACLLWILVAVPPAGAAQPSLSQEAGKWVQQTKKLGATAWEATKEGTGKAWEATKKGTGKAWRATKETAGDLYDSGKKKAGKVYEAVKSDD